MIPTAAYVSTVKADHTVEPDDDKVIATAIYGNVDYLATADEDLQVEPVISIIRMQGIRLTTIDEILTLLP